jgi:hypothetical protein
VSGESLVSLAGAALVVLSGWAVRETLFQWWRRRRR